jgi:hypothetical protein
MNTVASDGCDSQIAVTPKSRNEFCVEEFTAKTNCGADGANYRPDYGTDDRFDP